jgi:hypothetical protein
MHFNRQRLQQTEVEDQLCKTICFLLYIDVSLPGLHMIYSYVSHHKGNTFIQPRCTCTRLLHRTESSEPQQQRATF